MGKIGQIIVFPNPGYDTGQTSADKLNEAMETVESDATLSGDGTTGDPLKVESVPNVHTVNEQTITVGSNIIPLDWDSKNILWGLNELGISAAASVSFNNTGNSRGASFWLNITNTSVITFPSSVTVMQEFEKTAGRWDETTWEFTPASDGLYEFVLTKSSVNRWYLKVSDKNIG